MRHIQSESDVVCIPLWVMQVQVTYWTSRWSSRLLSQPLRSFALKKAEACHRKGKTWSINWTGLDWSRVYRKGVCKRPCRHKYPQESKSPFRVLLTFQVWWCTGFFFLEMFELSYFDEKCLYLIGRFASLSFDGLQDKQPSDFRSRSLGHPSPKVVASWKIGPFKKICRLPS